MFCDATTQRPNGEQTKKTQMPNQSGNTNTSLYQHQSALHDGHTSEPTQFRNSLEYVDCFFDHLAACTQL